MYFCMVGILDVLCSFHCQPLPTKQDLNTHQIWCLIRKALAEGEQSWSRDVRRKGFHYLRLEKMEYKLEQWQDGRNAAERFQGVSNRELTGWSASLHLGIEGKQVGCSVCICSSQMGKDALHQGRNCKTKKMLLEETEPVGWRLSISILAVYDILR